MFAIGKEPVILIIRGYSKLWIGLTALQFGIETARPGKGLKKCISLDKYVISQDLKRISSP